MRILIDIVHPADVNFYQKAIGELGKKHEIVLTVLGRGRLVDIVKKEYPKLKVIPLGKHRKGKIGKLLGLIDREIRFILLFLGKRFDRVSSFGWYPAIAAKLFGIKSVLFYDDYEYKINFNMCKIFSDRFIIPKSIPATGKNIKKYKGFKELAYLKDFKPNSISKRYSVKPNKYVFVRDVAPISLNYQDSKYKDFSELFYYLRKKGYEILYYPENKALGKKYHRLCKVLEGPVEDILSLIYYAKFVISSGDTIARESALLGTPTLYTTNRDMKVNKQLIQLKAIVKTTDIYEIEHIMKNFLKNDSKPQLRDKIKSHIKNNWQDTTAVIIKEILN